MWNSMAGPFGVEEVKEWKRWKSGKEEERKKVEAWKRWWGGCATSLAKNRPKRKTLAPPSKLGRDRAAGRRAVPAGFSRVPKKID